MLSSLTDDQLASKILSASDSHSALLLPSTANSVEAKAAYRRIARRLHPDKCQTGSAQVTEAFQRASSAVLQLQQRLPQNGRCLSAAACSYKTSLYGSNRSPKMQAVQLPQRSSSYTTAGANAFCGEVSNSRLGTAPFKAATSSKAASESTASFSSFAGSKSGTSHSEQHTD